jgi:hypothetical protein
VNPSSLLIYQDSIHLDPKPILPGHGARGEFIATENNLAILRIRLRTYNRLNTTHITFRLRQQGKVDWSVSNSYALDRISDGLLYPFGFAPVPDSKGNTYEFELSSDDGIPDNAIGVSGGYHGVAAEYVQPIPQIGSKKIISTIRDPYSVLYFSMFIVPAFIYAYKKYRVLLFYYLIAVYVYLPVTMHSDVVLFIAVTQVVVGYPFITGVLLLIQIPIMIAMENMLAADRIATLVFFSLVTAIIMAVREETRR